MSDDLEIPAVLVITAGARAAAWQRFTTPPAPRIVPREVDVARAAEKKHRTAERITKMKVKLATKKNGTTFTFPKPPPVVPAGLVADDRWPGMIRVKLGRGRVSDMANLTRAKDALAELGGR